MANDQDFRAIKAATLSDGARSADARTELDPGRKRSDPAEPKRVKRASGGKVTGDLSGPPLIAGLGALGVAPRDSIMVDGKSAIGTGAKRGGRIAPAAPGRR